ncbi:hypothetical protein ACQJBY_029066 [Aegilops geniculata]
MCCWTCRSPLLVSLQVRPRPPRLDARLTRRRSRGRRRRGGLLLDASPRPSAVRMTYLSLVDTTGRDQVALSRIAASSFQVCTQAVCGRSFFDW